VQDLGLSRSGYGFLVATMSIGNVAGALGASRFLARFGVSTSLIAAGLVAAVSYMILSTTHSAVAAAGALSLEAVGVVVSNITTISVRQWLVPAYLLGRVTTVWRMIILGLVPFGALAGGITAANLGIRATFLLAGSVQLGIAILLGPAMWKRLANVTASSRDPVR
jgi:hypothetical protein